MNRNRISRGGQTRFLANPEWTNGTTALFFDLCHKKGSIKYESESAVVRTDIPNIVVTPAVYFPQRAMLAIASSGDVWRTHGFEGLCDQISKMVNVNRRYVANAGSTTIQIKPIGRKRAFIEYPSRVSELKRLEIRLAGPNLDPPRVESLLLEVRNWIDGAHKATALVEGEKLALTTSQVA